MTATTMTATTMTATKMTATKMTATKIFRWVLSGDVAVPGELVGAVLPELPEQDAVEGVVEEVGA